MGIHIYIRRVGGGATVLWDANFTVQYQCGQQLQSISVIKKKSHIYLYIYMMFISV